MSGPIQTIRTPSGTLSIIRPTAERLLKEGVISGTLDGELHAADAAIVKAAIMSYSVCDFCSTPGAAHYYDVPDFGVTTRIGSYSATRSTGGWMACDTCDELIKRDRRKDLVKRAQDTHAFPKFSHRAIAELYDKFWQGMDDRKEAQGIGQIVLDYVEDKLNEAEVIPQYSTRDKRLAVVQRTMHLTPAEVAVIAAGGINRDITQKLVDWRKSLDPSRHADLRRLMRYFDAPKPLTEIVPHWQKALTAKFEAAAFLKNAKNDNLTAIDRAGFTNDAKALPLAQAYSFNEETIGAILEAAKSIPHDSPLSSIETPNTGAGWFWFGDNGLPVPSTPASDKTAALLWTWHAGEALAQLAIPSEVVEGDPELKAAFVDSGTPTPPMLSSSEIKSLSRLLRKRNVTQEQIDSWTTFLPGNDPSISFTAFFCDEATAKTLRRSVTLPIPSTRWRWRLNETFNDMLTRNGHSWEERYGEGSPYAHLPKLDKNRTTRCVHDLSMFFVMACLWFRQTVERPATLQKEQGPMNRQDRKRMRDEFDLEDVPNVQVVALRRTARSPKEPTEPRAEPAHREYRFRWIVRGHARLQACGPGRKDRKLIWIDAHPAGPDDKPLRTREKVFAVVR